MPSLHWNPKSNGPPNRVEINASHWNPLEFNGIDPCKLISIRFIGPFESIRIDGLFGPSPTATDYSHWFPSISVAAIDFNTPGLIFLRRRLDLNVLPSKIALLRHGVATRLNCYNYYMYVLCLYAEDRANQFQLASIDVNTIKRF